MREVLMRPVNLIRSSLIGVAIGALPGAGGSIANLVAYDQAKRGSKTPEKFGTGTPDGIVASEAGNSATAGGGLIPLIALGIPGSAVDAILMASLMVHGISIGPRLIMDNADLVYGMFLAMAVSSLMMLMICVLSMRSFLRVAEVPKWVVVPIVLVCCVVGSFALNNRVTDLYLLGFIGLFGYALKALDYPLAPLVLGVILGPIAETNLRRALMTDPDWSLFVTRPVSLIFLIAAVLSVSWAIRGILKSRKQTEKTEGYLCNEYASRRTLCLSPVSRSGRQHCFGLAAACRPGGAVDAGAGRQCGRCRDCDGDHADRRRTDWQRVGIRRVLHSVGWHHIARAECVRAVARRHGRQRFKGLDEMPYRGWESVTVPGAIAPGWHFRSGLVR